MQSGGFVSHITKTQPTVSFWNSDVLPSCRPEPSVFGRRTYEVGCSIVTVGKLPQARKGGSARKTRVGFVPSAYQERVTPSLFANRGQFTVPGDNDGFVCQGENCIAE